MLEKIDDEGRSQGLRKEERLVLWLPRVELPLFEPRAVPGRWAL